MPPPRAIIAPPPVDERVIKNMFGDDQNTFKEIMVSFTAPSQDIINAIDAAEKGRNLDEVSEAAHRLKSSARTIGANDLADTCVELEKAAKAGDWSNVDRLAARSRTQFAAVDAFVSVL